MPDAEFEKVFADLAHARLRDRAPGLLDYLVGFQLLDKNEDDTHAVGVWGFKVGSGWMYAPVFFLNGQLKGDELLYVKDQDAFVPMKEDWINYLLNRRPHVLGSTEEKKLHELGIRQPDFNALARPPYTGSKYASAGQMRSLVDYLTEAVSPEFTGFVPVIINSPLGEKRAELSDRWHLPNFIKKAGKDAAVRLIKTMRKRASFADAILKFYTMDELIKAAREAIDADPMTKASADGDKSIEGTAPTVQVMLADKANVNDLSSTMLSDSEKEKLQKDRYFVRDNRGDSDVAKAYSTQISKTLQNPSCSALCNVLTQSGGFKKMLVIKAPVGSHSYSNSSNGKDLSVVVKLDGKRVRMAASNDIFVDNEGHDAKQWESTFNGLSDPASVGERNKIVLVNAKCEGSAPFFIERKVTTADGQVRLYGEFDRFPMTDSMTSLKDMLRPKFRGRVFNQSDTPAGSYGAVCAVGDYDNCLIVTKKDGAQITQIGNDYFVPNGMKAMVLSKADIDPWRLDPKNKIGRRTPDPDELANPQTLADIEMQLFKSGMVSKIQPISDGIEFWLRVDGHQSRPMSKLAALKELIERHNLREQDATALLKMAKRSGSPEYFVSKPQMKKLARGSGGGGGGVPMPSSPYLPEPDMGVDPTLGVQVQYPQDVTLDAGIGPQPRMEMDMDATFRAEQAANSGQKEVMDTSVVGGLVKTMDPSAAIDSYISDLMLGLDRVGRILFMYYWHYEKFKEQYGSGDMPELEDNLRNVFENLGDLVIFLKQKTVEPEITGASSEAELTQIA